MKMCIDVKRRWTGRDREYSRVMKLGSSGFSVDGLHHVAHEKLPGTVQVFERVSDRIRAVYDLIFMNMANASDKFAIHEAARDGRCKHAPHHYHSVAKSFAKYK
jgi:hypothetical protein